MESFKRYSTLPHFVFFQKSPINFADRSLIILLEENKMSKETLKLAETLIKDVESAANWECVYTPTTLVRRLQVILDVQCSDPFYDVEDALNDIYIEMVIKRRFFNFTSTLTKILKNKGLNTEDSEGNLVPSRPTFEEISTKSNDDDLQGDEITHNNMDTIASCEVGPASDAHIASIDIGDCLGSRDVFELKISGATEQEISETLGLSRQQVSRQTKAIREFVTRHGYSHFYCNTALGDAKYISGQRYSFTLSRGQKQSDSFTELPRLTNHRSIVYTDREEPKLKEGVRPTGDEITNNGVGYELNIGIDNWDFTDLKPK